MRDLISQYAKANTRDHASTELAEKVDNKHHLMVFMIFEVCDSPHGASFKAWDRSHTVYASKDS